MAVVSLVDEYKKDATGTKVNVLSHYIRVSNITPDSPFIKVQAMLASIKKAINELLGGVYGN